MMMLIDIGTAPNSRRHVFCFCLFWHLDHTQTETKRITSCYFDYFDVVVLKNIGLVLKDDFLSFRTSKVWMESWIVATSSNVAGCVPRFRSQITITPSVLRRSSPPNLHHPALNWNAMMAWPEVVSVSWKLELTTTEESSNMRTQTEHKNRNRDIVYWPQVINPQILRWVDSYGYVMGGWLATSNADLGWRLYASLSWFCSSLAIQWPGRPLAIWGFYFSPIPEHWLWLSKFSRTRTSTLYCTRTRFCTRNYNSSPVAVISIIQHRWIKFKSNGEEVATIFILYSLLAFQLSTIRLIIIFERKFLICDFIHYIPSKYYAK